MKVVKKLTKLKIKDVWRYEDKELTPWLCENIDVVGDTIGVQLTNPTREQRTVNFSVDIKAEDIEGNFVVIENQYGSSDHDHLGKLITYLASFEARVAVWIVETPKPEHISAISWLNEGSNNCDFYLLKIEAVKIGNSEPAPLLTKIVGPSAEGKSLGIAKKEDAERFRLRLAFWEKLLVEAKIEGLTLFGAISPTKDTWISASAGIRGLSYNFWVNRYSVRIELRIDLGKGSEQENLRILNLLKGHKVEIESIFKDELAFADLEGYRVCSIRKDYEIGGYKSDEQDVLKVVQKLVQSMLLLEKATKPFLKQIKSK